MAQNTGTLITSAIRPNDSLDNIASAYANEIYGGWHSVATGVDRDNIYSSRLQEGMICYVVESGETFQYVSGATGLEWVVYSNSTNWIDIINKPTTLSGYSITEAWTSAQTISYLSSYSLTSHTHDSRYYTQTYINGTYYTKTEIDNLFYTSAQTNALLQHYYTITEANILLSGKSDIGHNHPLSGLTDVSVSSLTYGEVLIYYGGSWINSSITMDLSNYYNKTEVDNLLTAITFASGASALYDLTDVTLSGPSAGESLVYNGSIWVNSAVTPDLSNYYTITETETNFYNTAETNARYSLTSHTHTLEYLSNVSSGATNNQFLQFDASSSGWTPTTAEGLIGNYVVKSGDTMTGYLSFDFMTGTTDRVLHVDTGGTVKEGEEIVSFYISDPSTINYITSSDTSLWSGNTFISTGLTAYTLYSGQRYIDDNYFYEYFDGRLYRTDYARLNHNHNDLYYTKDELNPTGTTEAVLDDRYITQLALSSFTLYSLSDTDVDLVPGDWDFLKYDSDSGWTNYYIDLTGLTYKDEAVLTGTSVLGISGLTGGGYLNGDIFIEHDKVSTLDDDVAPDPHVVYDLDVSVFGHVTKIYKTDLDGYWIRYLDNAQDVNVSGRKVNDYLFWTGTEWRTTGLTTSRIKDFDDSNYVKSVDESYQFIEGDIEIQSQLTTSELLVNGDLTYIDSNLITSDNIIIINTGETFNGINTTKKLSITDGGAAGFQIDRGVRPNYYLLYDESGSYSTSGGTVKIGIGSDLKSITTIENFSNYRIPYWVDKNNYGYFDTSSNLSWNGSTLVANGNIQLSGYMTDTNYIWNMPHSGGTIALLSDISTYSPAGDHGEIQINSGGTMGATSNFLYDFEDISLAIGSGVTANGKQSLATGIVTIANGQGSHSEGWLTVATGDVSHAEGVLTNSNGQFSHAEGFATISSGLSSHAEGKETTAIGDLSHSNGYNTVASSYAEFVIGQYNYTGNSATTDSWVDSEQLFTVGNGNSSNTSNALTVYKNGNMKVNQKITANNIELTGDGEGVIMVSPGGNRFYLTIDDDGILTVDSL